MSSESARARALVGTTVDGRYRFDEVLATGAMGTVYLGRHLNLKKRVAIKVLHPDVEDHPELVLRFEREALVGAQVSHANIAGATDFGDLADGSRYLVMEHVKGETLRSLIDRESPLEAKRAVRIATEIARALEHAHGRGIVHRDLKPRNVMVAEGDGIKLIDFGLAKIDGARLSTLPDDEAEEDSRLTGRGVIFGTVEYLAPEAAFGMELVDARADLYALGVILYEMLTGKHPFEAKTEAELFAKQRHAPAPKMSERAPGVVVEPALEDVVAKLLHKDFDERYQTAAEVIAALEQASSPARPAFPAPPPPSAQAESKPAPKSESTPGPTPEPKPASSPPSAARAPSSRPPPPARAPAPAPTETERRPSPMPWIAGAVVALAAGGYFAFRGEPEPPAPPPRTTATQVEPPAPPPAPTRAKTEPPVPTAAHAPSASASAPDPELVRDILARLRTATANASWKDAATETLALLQADAHVLRDASASGAISEMLVALDKERDPRADEVWEAVALAEGGPDLVYRYVETHGKASFAERARTLLSDKRVKKNASDAVNVAFALREAPCDKKIAMLDRAVEVGDQRAELVIDLIVRLCVKNEEPIDEALKKMRDKRKK